MITFGHFWSLFRLTIPLAFVMLAFMSIGARPNSELETRHGGFETLILESTNISTYIAVMYSTGDLRCIQFNVMTSDAQNPRKNFCGP